MDRQLRVLPDDFAPALGKALLLLAVMLTAGALGGAISATGQLGLIGLFGAMVIGSLIVPSRKALLWFIVIGGIVVTGAAQLYVPGARYVRYVVPLVSLVLVLHGILGRLVASEPPNRQLVGIRNWAIAFALVALVSSALNFRDGGSLFVGLKDYFQMSGVLVAMALVSWRQNELNSLPKLFFMIALLQLPFVLHQYLVLVPQRVGHGGGLVAVDVVAGTFGASKFGGGANAVLALYLIIVSAVLVGLWKYGQLSRARLLMLVAILLSPTLVNGAKVTVLYIPLVFLVIFYRDVVQRPLRFIFVFLLMAAILSALMTAFTQGKGSTRVQSWTDLVAVTLERQTATIGERGADYAGLTRWTALTFWAKQHERANPAHILIGHGPGSSRVQTGGLNLASSLAETRYGGLQIGQTAVAALLWDVGVLGLVCMFGLLFAAFTTAGRLAMFYRDTEPWLCGFFEGLRAGVAVIALSLFHKDFLVFNLPFQTLVTLLLGYLIACTNLIPSGFAHRLKS